MKNNPILSHFAQEGNTEVRNDRKYILVIGMTGSGKSSFVNFITGTNKCLVSNSASPCPKNSKWLKVYI